MNERTRRKLVKLLKRLYPHPGSELEFDNEYQLVVSVILSAQCTDKKVNQVTPALFKKYPSFPALAAARATTLEAIIRPVNYYKTKARNLIGMAKEVTVQFSGRLPRERDSLMTLPGVGQKTANVILIETGSAPAFPVDTHVFRVSRRLGLAGGADRFKVEHELEDEFPPAQWRDMHHWLILHGRRVCTAARPHCSACALAGICPSAFKVKGAR